MAHGPRSEQEAFGQQRPIERAVFVARLIGAALAVALGPFIPNIGEPYVLGLAGFLIAYDRALAFATGRVPAERLNKIAFALDTVAVLAALVILSPQPTWDVILVVPIFLLTAAVRLGAPATIGALVLLSVADVAISAFRELAYGFPFQIATVALELGLFMVAAVLVLVLLQELEGLRTRETTLFQPLLRSQDALGEAILIREGQRITTISDAFVRLTGYDRSEIPDLDALMRLVPEPERGAVLERMATASLDRFDLSLLRKDGQRIWVEVARKAFGDPASSQVVVLIRDITDRKRAQQELEQSVLRDALTGLPNAAVLKDRARQAIAESRRQGSAVSLVLVVLDGFQFVTETVGLPAANRILFELAGRLRQRTREVDTVARLTGDAFAVLLLDCDEQGARRVATIIANELAEPFELGTAATGPLDIRTSIGVAVWPGHAENVEALLRCAESAARHALRDDEPFVIYRPEQVIVTTGAFQTIAELRSAIRGGGLRVHYQPIIELRDQRVVGLEALVRWAHPERGIRPAAEFITLVEEAGLVRQLTDVVMTRVGLDARDLLASAQTEPLWISINLSTRSLRDERLAEKVRTLLRTGKLAPWRVTLEVTESAVMADPDRSLRTLNELRAVGVRIVVDDFGTGHSSLAYIQRLPIHGLKIDRSFVARMTTDKASAAIVRATLDLAKHLELQVTAEGIEDRRTLAAVRSYGADTAQGYAIAHPMPLADLPAWIESYEHALIGIDVARINAERS